MLAPFTSSLKNFFGTKNAIIGALFVEALCIVLIGVVSTVNDPATFKWFAIILRFAEGLADMLLQVSSYTTITYVFQEEVMKYCAITEIFLALGLQFGPFIGEAIYAQLHFRLSLYVFGCMCILVCIVSMWCLPNSLDKKMELDQSIREIRDEESNRRQNQKILTWGKISKSKSVMDILALYLVGILNQNFWIGGYMVTHLSDIGVSEDKLGSIFFVAGTASLFVSVLVFFYMKTFPRRLVFVLAMFGFFVSSLMIGPSTVIRLPDKGWIIAAGIII